MTRLHLFFFSRYSSCVLAKSWKDSETNFAMSPVGLRPNVNRGIHHKASLLAGKCNTCAVPSRCAFSGRVTAKCSKPPRNRLPRGAGSYQMLRAGCYITAGNSTSRLLYHGRLNGSFCVHLSVYLLTLILFRRTMLKGRKRDINISFTAFHVPSPNSSPGGSST